MRYLVEWNEEGTWVPMLTVSFADRFTNKEVLDACMMKIDNVVDKIRAGGCESSRDDFRIKGLQDQGLQ